MIDGHWTGGFCVRLRPTAGGQQRSYDFLAQDQRGQGSDAFRKFRTGVTVRLVNRSLGSESLDVISGPAGSTRIPTGRWTGKTV